MIIPAQARHHAALADLLEAVYIGEGFAPASSRDRLRDIAAIAGAGMLLVAPESKGDGVAGAVVYLEPGVPLSEIARPGEAEMRLLAVRHDHRGQGLGGKLVRACIALASSRSCGMVLSTQPAMTAAQRLYHAEGFERDPSRDWVHVNGSLRLVFIRPVDGLSP